MNQPVSSSAESAHDRQTELNVAFWNLQNLFDPDTSAIAAELEYTPVFGWDRRAFDIRIRNLAEVIRAMFDGRGPDLLGICEIENERVARRLIQEIGRSDYQLALVKQPLHGALDTALIYSDRLLKFDAEKSVGHVVNLRFPTIDILEVHLQVLQNGAELMVLVNHWPSRRGSSPEAEGLRMTAASHCQRLVRNHLKLNRKEYLELADTDVSLFLLNDIQDRNILIMGDLNDEPWSHSVRNTLGAGYSTEMVDDPIRMVRGSLPSYRVYGNRPVWLFNPMWALLSQPDQGTCCSGSNSSPMILPDQFIISRGRWIGGGDIRLGLLLGAFIAWPGILFALCLAYILGSLYGIALVLRKKKSWQSAIPFGTFLTLAGYVFYLMSDRVLPYLT